MDGNFKKPLILIAADNFIIRDRIKSFYKNYNFELIEAVNGQEAVEMASTFIFDLILLDIKMPDLSGYEVATILKNDEAVKNIPIVAFAYQQPEAVAGRVKGVYDGYVNKPFKKDYLLKATMKYLQRSIHKNAVAQKANMSSGRFF